MSRKLYKEHIDKYKISTGCIPESAQNYIDQKTGVIDLARWKEEDESTYIEWASSIINCGSGFYNNPNFDGCCYNENANSGCKTKDNDTGLKFLGISEDVNGNRKIGNLCHKENLSGLSNIFDDPNHIVKFFKLIIVSIVMLLTTAIIGTCYEFWLRYGNSVECIYYKSKCANIGKKERISLIDYMFPNSLCYYPYQSCSEYKPNQSGGTKKSSGIISTFAEYENAGAKCITLEYDTTIYGEKPIPYNIADYAINNTKSEFITVLAKTISFFFLFPVLFARKFLNYFLSRLSGKFQRIFKFNPLLNNINFLILTGLLFPFIGYFSDQNTLYFGPFIYISGLIGIVGIIMSIGFFVAFIATIFPGKLFRSSLDACNIPDNYYQIFRPELFYPLRDMDLSRKVFNVIKNIILFFPLIFLVVSSIVIGSIVSVIAAIYMNLSLLFNIFYIPLSNPLECFSILKSHADLLTILFCIGVIGSAANSLDPTTTGVMSGILMLIIVYKAFKGMKTSV